jgi:hypothetical protein
MGAMNNEGALIVPFIRSLGSRSRVVKRREAVAVEFQWQRLWEMEMGRGGDGLRPFLEGKLGEVRRLHGVEGERHSE